jgi:8-oxo-dGTP pyrophosphatase MutT (NUDIX family)
MFSPTLCIQSSLSLGKRLSCGIVIVNDASEVLLCHVTGQDHWDLPKGGAMTGESPVQTALRETREETGLVLDAAAMLDLGRLGYRVRKDLHLFAARVPRFDTGRLWCESHFADSASGRPLPEMDGYGWFTFSEVPVHCSRKLSVVLRERLDLAALLAALSQRESSPVHFMSAPTPVQSGSTWLPPVRWVA